MTARAHLHIPSAWDQVLAQLVKEEAIEGVVFGRRQRGISDGELVPEEIVGQLLTAEDAQRHMQSWTITPPPIADASSRNRAEDQRWDLPQPFYLWTNLRVFAVTADMGRIGLTWQPRNPVAWDPDFAGQLPPRS